LKNNAPVLRRHSKGPFIQGNDEDGWGGCNPGFRCGSRYKAARLGGLSKQTLPGMKFSLHPKRFAFSEFPGKKRNWDFDKRGYWGRQTRKEKREKLFARKRILDASNRNIGKRPGRGDAISISSEGGQRKL